MSSTEYTLSATALAAVQQDVAAGNYHYPAAYSAIAQDLNGRADHDTTGWFTNAAQINDSNSTTFMHYFAPDFPQAGMAPPPGHALRGPYYRWLFFAASPLEAAWTNQALGFTVPPDRQRMTGYGSFAAVLDALEGAVSRGPYLVGDSFTAADLYVGSQLGFGLQFGMIEKRPAFVDYVGRLTARPAAVRAKSIDDALVPASS